MDEATIVLSHVPKTIGHFYTHRPAPRFVEEALLASPGRAEETGLNQARIYSMTSSNVGHGTSVRWRHRRPDEDVAVTRSSCEIDYSEEHEDVLRLSAS